MGFVTQDYSRSLLPWFSVEKNVALPFRGKNIDKEKRRKAVQEILESVGLTQFAKYYPWQLSGGMQQKVAIARALILSPRLLLLDEPFASVDAQLRLELEDLVATLVSKKKITTIIVTHDMDEAIYMADRVILLSGSPAKIKKIYVVSLEKPRNQIVTRENSTFLKLRNELYEDLKG
jgi:NitT/TauT family transport system ATP-binding protein